jgi:serine/threonine-protein kinase
MGVSPATIRKASHDTAHPSGPLTMPPELLAEASRRLGWAGLIYGMTYALAYFGPQLIVSLADFDHGLTHAQDIFALCALLTGVGVFVLARRSVLSPQRLLDLGLGFDVVGAYLIALTEYWVGFGDFRFDRYLGIPWECAWIIIFPLVAPNTPRKILIASLLAASSGPVTILVTGWATGVRAVEYPVVFVAYFLSTNFTFAVLAYVIARIVYHYGVRLKRARDVGAYQLIRRLAEGGMGEVWTARHRLLARPAAIKLIRSDLLGANPQGRAAAVRRFEREARATANLGSTHTVDIYDFGVAEDGSFYYVMELLDGMSLEMLVRRFGPISAARAVFLLRQVCHSLSEAHARGLIHRDIKPANIFTCRLGPDHDFVKVLDFGLVKQAPGLTRHETQVTMEGATAGTPAFMAPEMALGHEIDGRADLYALGCVAYWLLTGQPVFSGETPVATILAHVREDPLPPSARTEIAIPPMLEAVIMSCLAKDPRARPSSADELTERLAACMPSDGWDRAAARQWWEIHQTSSFIPGADDDTESSVTLIPRRT